MPSVEAVILASGFSRRLGVDKVSQDICGKSVLSRVVETALGAGLEKVVVVLRERGQSRMVPNDARISILYNENAESGMSSAIKLAILRSEPQFDSFLFLNGDMPFFSADSLARLIGLWKRNPEKIACIRNGETLRGPVIFPRKYTSMLLGLEGENGGRELLMNNSSHVVFIEIANQDELVDIDTQEDLERARKICRSISS